MNNRWKELNEEAEKYALSKVNSAGYCFETNMYIGSLVKMKLAELIIKECARVDSEMNNPDHVDGKSFNQTILEHFGVE